MKKLSILLVVLAMCLPAYGYILVYKLTASGTSANFDNYPDGWLLEKASGSGYLVLDVNDEDANILNDVQYIDRYTEKVDNKPTKLYDIWTAGGNFLQNILPGRPPKGKNITTLNVDLWNGNSSLQLTGLLLGTNSLTDIGTLDDEEVKTKVDVTASLKGSFQYISGENLGEPNETLEEHGTGTLSVTLDSKWTKIANNPDTGFGGDIASFLNPSSPRGLINWLKSAGYNLATD